MNRKILTKKVISNKFSWFEFYVNKLRIIMCIGIAPLTTVLK